MFHNHQIPIMNNLSFLTIIFIALFSCQNSPASSPVAELSPQPTVLQASNLIDTSKHTIATRFAPPSGFVRQPTQPNSWANYLQNFALLPHNTPVYYYNGAIKTNEVHAAVLDIDIGKRDLQQCADAIMRLRAEHLYHTQQYDAIHFHFTNGFDAQYSKWRQGHKISVKGNKVSWYKARQQATSYKQFRQYLNMVFAYAGTLSLDKELQSRPLEAVQIGDVFIQGGSPGHAIIVVDMAIHPQTQEKMILLAQSYMPAQNIHILNNYNTSKHNPWYSINDINQTLHTPEWTFDATNLKTW